MKRTIIAILWTIGLSATTAAVNPYISKVYEFQPAPGQFVNKLPSAESTDTKEAILSKVAEQICGNEDDGAKPGMISLGAFGGYVVFGFDHPVVNVEGEYDFKVYGNAFGEAGGALSGGSCEPGIVEVSYDANGNGKPDDAWYELAGSDYNDPATEKEYTITYYKPAADRPVKADPDPTNTAITDRTYVKWTSSTGETGYVMRNAFHTQSYWPLWGEGETLTFTGTKLKNNSVNTGTAENPNYVLLFFDWGYVDNQPEAKDPGFKIEWAVDSKGNKVNLPCVNFIKVHTAVNQYNGHLGECSTEVCGGEDLHPQASGVSGVTSDNSGLRLVSNTESTLKLWSAKRCRADIYTPSGALAMQAQLEEGVNDIDVSSLTRGVYIVSTTNGTMKIVKR